jgi:hypothetical protein
MRLIVTLLNVLPPLAESICPKKRAKVEDLSTAICGHPGLREDTQLSQSSPLVIQSLSGVPDALSR